MTKILNIKYQGIDNRFTDEGWFNATIAADKFDKRPNDWLSLPSTKEYLAAMQRRYPEVKKFYFARKGGNTRLSGNGKGTWLHPKLAVRFAQWLDLDFAVWCDEQIDNIIRNNIPACDIIKLRHEVASSLKVMNAVLLTKREEEGKITEKHHYINEARLINNALTGEFRGIDRDNLPEDELYLLAKLEEKNAVLIGLSHDYRERKGMLEQYCHVLRGQQQRMIAA